MLRRLLAELERRESPLSKSQIKSGEFGLLFIWIFIGFEMFLGTPIKSKISAFKFMSRAAASRTLASAEAIATYCEGWNESDTPPDFASSPARFKTEIICLESFKSETFKSKLGCVKSGKRVDEILKCAMPLCPQNFTASKT